MYDHCHFLICIISVLRLFTRTDITLAIKITQYRLGSPLPLRKPGKEKCTGSAVKLLREGLGEQGGSQLQGEGPAAHFSSFLSPESHAQRSCLCSSHHPGPLHTRDTVPAPALSSSRTCCSTSLSRRFHAHQPALRLSCCLTAFPVSVDLPPSGCLFLEGQECAEFTGPPTPSHELEPDKHVCATSH